MPPINWTMMLNSTIPTSVKIVRHDADKIQASKGQMELLLDIRNRMSLRLSGKKFKGLLCEDRWVVGSFDRFLAG